MGLLKILKNIFSRPLKVSSNSSNDVITLVSKGAKIKIGKKLVVPKGFVCFLVAKEKVLDRYVEGTYHLTINEIPALCRELKLNIPNKKNKYKQFFKADVYFVNLKNFENQTFASEQGIYIKKDDKFLGTIVYVDGKYSYKIKDPQLFLDCLLKVYGVIKFSLAQRRLDIFTGELIDKKIQKNKPSLEELYERNTNCFLGLVDYLNSNMMDVGIEYLSAEVLNVDMPNRIYRQVELSFQEKQENKEKFQPFSKGKQTNVWYKNEPEISTVKEAIEIEKKVGNSTTEINAGSLLVDSESDNVLSQEEFNKKEQLRLEREYFDNLDANTDFGLVEDNDNQAIVENQDNINEANISTNDEALQVNDFNKNNGVVQDVKIEQSEKTLNETHESVFDFGNEIKSFGENEQLTEQMSTEGEKNCDSFNNVDIENNNHSNNETDNGFENNNGIDEIPNSTESLEQMQKKVSYKKCSHCGAINSKSSNICFNCKNEFKKICQNCKTEISNGDFVCPKCKSIVI